MPCIPLWPVSYLLVVTSITAQIVVQDAQRSRLAPIYRTDSLPPQPSSSPANTGQNSGPSPRTGNTNILTVNLVDETVPGPKENVPLPKVAPSVDIKSEALQTDKLSDIPTLQKRIGDSTAFGTTGSDVNIDVNDGALHLPSQANNNLSVVAGTALNTGSPFNSNSARDEERVKRPSQFPQKSLPSLSVTLGSSFGGPSPQPASGVRPDGGLLKDNPSSGSPLKGLQSRPSLFVSSQQPLRIVSKPSCSFPVGMEDDPHQLSTSEFGYPKSIVDQALKNSVASAVLETLRDAAYGGLDPATAKFQKPRLAKAQSAALENLNILQDGSLFHGGNMFAPLNFNSFNNFDYPSNDVRSHVPGKHDTPGDKGEDVSEEMTDPRPEKPSGKSRKPQSNTGTDGPGQVLPSSPGTYNQYSQNGFLPQISRRDPHLLDKSKIDRLFPPKSSGAFLDVPTGGVGESQDSPFTTNKQAQRSKVDGPFSFNTQSLFGSISNSPFDDIPNLGLSTGSDGRLSSSAFSKPSFDGSNSLFSTQSHDQDTTDKGSKSLFGSSQLNLPSSFRRKRQADFRSRARQQSVCTPTYKMLRQYMNYGGACYVAMPEFQAIYYSECSYSPCSGCSVDGGGASRCTAERVPMWVWSHCEEGPYAGKVMPDRVDVAVACTCKTVLCRPSGPGK